MEKWITQYTYVEAIQAIIWNTLKRKQEDKAPIQALFCTQIQVAQQTSQEIAAAPGSPPEQLLVVFIIQELVYSPKKDEKSAGLQWEENVEYGQRGLGC